MLQHHCSMHPLSHTHIHADGTVAPMLAAHPSAPKFGPHAPFTEKPVQVRFGRDDLRMVLFGEHFDVEMKLTQDDALHIVSMLVFQLRNQLANP